MPTGIPLYVIRRNLDSAYLVNGQWDQQGNIQAYTPAQSVTAIGELMSGTQWANCEILQLLLPN